MRWISLQVQLYITITTYPPFLKVGLKHIGLSTGRDNLSVGRVLEQRLKASQLSPFISRLNFKAAEGVAGVQVRGIELTIRKKAEFPALLEKWDISGEKRQDRWTRLVPDQTSRAAGTFFGYVKNGGKSLNATEVKTRRKTDVLSTDRETDYKQEGGGSGGKNPNETKKETLLLPLLTFPAD